MRARVRAAWLAAIAGLASAPVWAQAAPNRYELGQRMRRFERAIHTAMHTREFSMRYRNEYYHRFKPPLPETREAAAHRALRRATQAYLALNPSEAAHWLDVGYGAMLGTDPRRTCVLEDFEKAALQWRNVERSVATALRAPRWIHQTESPTLEISWPRWLEVGTTPTEGPTSLERTFQVLLTKDDLPKQRVDFQQTRAQGASVTWPAEWGSGDAWLTLKESVGDFTIEVGRQQVSWIPDGDQRLAALRRRLDLGEGLGAHQRATLEFQLQMLQQLEAGVTFETDLPAHRVLGEAETLSSAESLGAWLTGRSGEFWLALRGKQDGHPKGRAHLRAFVPPHSDEVTQRPCVLALHGMGGSENLFFDGYGAGKIVELCRDRGWVLIAPRAGFTGIGMPFEQLWDVLAEPLAIDRERILVLGHSMGASAAMNAVRENTGPSYRAVAAIAGGGPKWRRPVDHPTRFLVLTGSEDFALGQARRLRDRLQGTGAETRYVELSGVEHLGAVQFGLPTVFAFFDEALGQ